MNEIKEYTEKMFEDIKHVDENSNEATEQQENNLERVTEIMAVETQEQSKQENE